RAVARPLATRPGEGPRHGARLWRPQPLGRRGAADRLRPRVPQGPRPRDPRRALVAPGPRHRAPPRGGLGAAAARPHCDSHRAPTGDRRARRRDHGHGPRPCRGGRPPRRLGCGRGLPLLAPAACRPGARPQRRRPRRRRAARSGGRRAAGGPGMSFDSNPLLLTLRLVRQRRPLCIGTTLLWALIRLRPVLTGVFTEGVFDALSGAAPTGWDAWTVLALALALDVSRIGVF